MVVQLLSTPIVDLTPLTMMPTITILRLDEIGQEGIELDVTPVGVIIRSGM